MINFTISETEGNSWEGRQEKSRQYVLGGGKRRESSCLLRVRDRQFIAGGMWGVDCGGKRSYGAHNFYFKARWMYLMSSRVMKFCCFVSLVPCKTASFIPKLRFEKCCVGFPWGWSESSEMKQLFYEKCPPADIWLVLSCINCLHECAFFLNICSCLVTVVTNIQK